MAEKISKMKAIQEFFGPVTTKELLDLRKQDPNGFDEVALLAAAELGKEIETRV